MNRSRASTQPRANHSSNGPIVFAPTLAANSPKESLHFASKRLSTGVTENRARAADRRYSAFATHRTKQITAPRAKPGESCLPTEVFRVYCAKIGRARSKN